MRKFIVKLTKYLITLAIIYPFAIYLLGSLFPYTKSTILSPKRNPKTALSGHFHELKEIDSVDLLILGSSHAFRSFDTREFDKIGIKPFVFASSGQTPMQTITLLERYLDKIKPRYVLWESYPYIFCSDGIGSQLDLITNDTVYMETILSGITSLSIKQFNSSIYNYIFQRINGFQFNREKPKYPYIKGGYIETKDQFYKSTNTFKKGKTWKLNPKQLEALDKGVKLFKERNIKFQFIESPYSTEMYSSYTNHDEFVKTIAQRGPYKNYNQILNLTDTLHFYDIDHLNSDGVKIFMKQVLIDLKKSSFFNYHKCN